MTKRIPLDKIVRNADQPRQFFDEAKLRELAASIRERGLMQAITVRHLPDQGVWQIISGERRWRAHQLLAEEGALGKKPAIMCEVIEVDDDEMALQAIVENLARSDIKPLEESRAFQAMLDRGWTPERLAKDLGISQSWRIKDRTKLLALDETIQTLVDGGQFPVGHAWEIADLPAAQQTVIVQAFTKGKITNWAGIKAAAQAARDRRDQPGMFGEGNGNPEPSQADRETLSKIERMVDKVVGAIGSGWHNGEFTAVKTVDPNKAAHLADTMAQASKTLRNMESQLRAAHARSTLL